MLDKEAPGRANLSTRFFRISGVTGSFFCVLCASIRFAPARVSLTMLQCVGSSTNATWWAQDKAFTASSIGALVADFCMRNIRYNATCSREAGSVGISACLFKAHHFQCINAVDIEVFACDESHSGSYHPT